MWMTVHAVTVSPVIVVGPDTRVVMPIRGRMTSLADPVVWGTVAGRTEYEMVGPYLENCRLNRTGHILCHIPSDQRSIRRCHTTRMGIRCIEVVSVVHFVAGSAVNDRCPAVHNVERNIDLG